MVLVHNSDKPLKQKATKPIVKKKETPIIKEQKNLPEVYKAEVYKPSLLRSRNVIRVLTIICGLLLGALAWTLFRLFPTERNRQKEAIKNAVERKLSDTLQLSSTNTLLVTSSLFPQPVFLTDTLYLQKDSLYILGNEKFVLRADTGYKGPAIVISPACKYILLENMVFENFDVAILSNNRSLHLKNVQFKNCRVPVSYQFLFPDNSFVSGDISDSSYYKTDSLPQ